MMLTLPVLPLRVALIHPEAVVQIPIDRLGAIAACERAQRGDGRVIVLAQREPAAPEPGPDGLYDMGIIGRIVEWTPEREGRYQARIAGEAVVQILALETSGAVWRARAIPLLGHVEQVDTEPLVAAMRGPLQRRGGVPVLALANLPSLSPLALAGFAALHAQEALGPEGLQDLLERPLGDRVARLTDLWRRVSAQVEAGMRAAGDPLRPPDPVEEDELGELPDGEHAVAWLVEMEARLGGTDRDGLVEQVLPLVEVVWEDDEALSDALDPDELRDRVDALATRAYLRWRSEAASWTRPTQAEKLRALMEGLDQQGVAWGWVDAQDLDEVLASWRADPGDPPVRGAVWLTRADAEGAVRGAGVRLSFGSSDDDTTDAEVGRIVVEALEEAGLPVWWPGRADVKIHVPIRWRFGLL